MSKRFLTLVLALAMLLALYIPTAGAEAVLYVYSDNGGYVNVRTEPQVNAPVIRKYDYGSTIIVYAFLDNGWAIVSCGTEYNNAKGYMQSRYIITNPPAPKAPSAPKPTSKNYNTVDEINNLLKSAKQVTPYMITVRPTRASGWVYVRWIPSKNSIAVATYQAGKQLRVIAELKDWFQVTDPDTGAVGFVFNSYVAENTTPTGTVRQ